MTAPVKLNLKIYQGSTFYETLRWESATKVYVPITNISKTAPMVVTAINHGVPAGWRTKISSVQGMKEANSADYVMPTQVTTNNLTYNNINALGYTAYTSGGVLEYNQPIDLSGYTARMQVREKITSTSTLLDLTSANEGVVLDNTNKLVIINIAATQTAGLNFNSAVYSLEIVSGTQVIPLLYGSVSLVKEVTR